MISVEGAKMLAQVIPIALLIMAVERRWLGSEPEPFSPIGWAWYWVKATVQGFVVIGCVVSMWFLFISINDNVPVAPDRTWGVALTMLGLTYAVMGVLISLTLRSYLGLRPEDAVELRHQRAARYERRRLRCLRRRAIRKLRRRRSASPPGSGGGDPSTVGSPPR